MMVLPLARRVAVWVLMKRYSAGRSSGLSCQTIVRDFGVADLDVDDFEFGQQTVLYKENLVEAYRLAAAERADCV